ncbi:hypothetical protein BX600DRAFT_541146 [Xylariales sp. PMI_506]|nr:hypothetical protein BX600DRAFT_541146 [Xylariales sp. PMI_506]
MAGSEAVAVGKALVDFALHGDFPEEDVSSRRVGVQDFGPALTALTEAKAKLEAEVHIINQETEPDVQSWVANAKLLEDDINRSRNMANDIVRRSEAPEVSGQTIREAEEKVDFLRREVSYNQQLQGALASIREVNSLLDQVEKAREERRVLDSLRLLERSWDALDKVPVTKSCRVMRILEMRTFELKSSVHDVFDHVWQSLVQIDTENKKVEIHESRPDEPMSLSEAHIGLKAYKELDQRMAIFWRSLDEAIIGPRTSLRSDSLPGVSTDGTTLRLSGHSDQTISSLFADLEQIMGYLSQRLPEELVQSLSFVMMPDLIPRIKNLWLDSAVPLSLTDMDKFQDVIGAVRLFCNNLTELKYSGLDELQEWVGTAPHVWLTKCKETALDTVRVKLVQGLGASREVERVETQQVSRSEGQDLMANGAPATEEDDWGSAWDDGGDAATAAAREDAHGGAAATTNEEDGADAWGWGEENDTAPADVDAAPELPAEEDDGGDAWGWGDDDAAQEAPQAAPAHAAPAASNTQTREMTLRETYKISSMPEPVLALIAAILEDGASLVASEGSPVAAAAAGLFSLPTLVLAMFRAVSPYYYALDMSGGGNMFLYNDATYLSERLADLVTSWKARDDLQPRAIAMLRLDNEIKTLKSFAARAYASEMSTQRTIIRDLLGGAQNLLQQDADAAELSSQIEAATSRVRTVAAIWSGVASKSIWSQAVGALADTLASKLVADVMELPAIGQEEAYKTANLIAKIIELDDLFLPAGAGEDAVPETSQYADNWLRLKYLSEVLQSNLQDVKFLWLESDLSLYFTVDEVVDLIGLSFVDNARTRDVVREIRTHPQPRV